MQLVFVLAVFSFAVIALLMAIEKYVEVRMPAGNPLGKAAGKEPSVPVCRKQRLLLLFQNKGVFWIAWY
ncbi:hypothetical protein [Salidesulfovibrio brasiliensis]|uniref:hypothetical protein n=1 Tax=Salidesulfovibrio brasiliensis TaxID=221711 RepID=UPI0012EE531D|nr:hypothetical protein [Salidesulfovibrio brasiliensis]